MSKYLHRGVRCGMICGDDRKEAEKSRPCRQRIPLEPCAQHAALGGVEIRRRLARDARGGRSRILLGAREHAACGRGRAGRVARTENAASGDSSILRVAASTGRTHIRYLLDSLSRLSGRFPSGHRTRSRSDGDCWLACPEVDLAMRKV